MIDKYFILHLSLIPDIGPGAIQKIIERIRSGACASDLYSFSASDWMHYCGLTEKSAYKVFSGLSDKKIFEKELSLIKHHQIKWVTIVEDSYPKLLRAIYMPPAVVYWQGGEFDDRQKHIAIVGARAANTYGQRIVTSLVPDLVAAGMAIVSGGARGIDTIAHEVAVQSHGRTIVVLGSGLLEPYPLSNKALFKRVVENNGLIVSCFPLLFQPLPAHFPARNRIIAGLSHGSIVVQAAQKSGALITAHYALEQGRDVFAVPGPIDDPLSAGCHALIQNGAKLITSAADIIEEYGMKVQSSVARDIQITLHDAQKLLTKKIVEKKEMSFDNNYSDVQKQIMNACARPSSLDDIIQVTNLPMDTVQLELFNLQLDGKVAQDFIGMWSIIRW